MVSRHLKNKALSFRLLAFCYNIGGGKFVLGLCPARLSLRLDANGAFLLVSNVLRLRKNILKENFPSLQQS
jgi:hypothetical protein